MQASTQSTTQSAQKRRKMTIEEVLRWTIRDELPKRRDDQPIRGPMPPAMHAMWRAGVFGGPIDNWSREPGMPLAMGDPHPDAITIEAHLQVLGETLQLAAAGSAACPLDLSAYPIQTELRGKANLEVLISAALHATPAWLMTCAIRGSRPDVGGGIEVEAVKSDNGKITLWRTITTPCGEGPDGKPWFASHDEIATSKGDARDTGLFCKLKFTRTGAEVVEEQLRYAFWHAALAYLVPALQFLTSIEVLPPKSSAAPWIEPQEEDRAPLPNLRPRRHIEPTNRRAAGRKALPLRASPVRKIDPRDWRPASERTA
ncbi:hypothetical protein MKK67_07105 [Methylobacterium sp. J-072]|uniref:hypothetical protein n=1 Tax=Methylobacterium sp. J-072 TaxID=2836651 RepID=UPI001FB93CA1|nr:hypothetical protein [Methylobacterium sp. J-072]MCJ2092262.1 hypothetical protein [Methylobacterium sp. J-072]